VTPIKYIEREIARFIIEHYSNVIEIGIGRNPVAARIIKDSSVKIRCSDIIRYPECLVECEIIDDVFSPDIGFYHGVDAIYSIRPAPEMIPPMKEIAVIVNADLIVYHLGFEIYGDGGEIVCSHIPIHRYHKSQ